MATAKKKKDVPSGESDEEQKPSGRKAPKKVVQKQPESKASPNCFEFRLYVVGHSPRSRNAIANLERICEKYLSGECHIEVIDLLEHPELAKENQIVAIPTLIKDLPLPVWVMIGDLSNVERVLAKLGLSAPDDSSGPGISR